MVALTEKRMLNQDISLDVESIWATIMSNLFAKSEAKVLFKKNEIKILRARR